MTDKRLTITEADFDQKGSFCDTGSGNTYQNVDDFGKEVAISEAVGRGETVFQVDDAPPGDSYGLDQRFNIIHEEPDGQGIYGQAKHGAGK